MWLSGKRLISATLPCDGLAVSFSKRPPSLVEFSGIDVAITIDVPACEPALHRLDQFFLGNLLITICVNQVEECGGSKADKERATAAKFVWRELAIAIDIGGAQQPAQFAGNFFAARRSVTVGIENFQLARAMDAGSFASITSLRKPNIINARTFRFTLRQGSCRKAEHQSASNNASKASFRDKNH
ncbi:MAG: hypothetical protein O7F69_06110 [Alphaproteobacteria bacterium]|nr:hypothetical protein [Alphaproteobacteria bacterium]